MSVNFE